MEAFNTRVADYLIGQLRPYWFRGKGRILNALTPHEGSRRARIFGYEATLNLKDLIQRNVYLGTFEPYESKVIRSNLKPGMTFVDVGANIGYFSLMAASNVGSSGKVFAIEPSPVASQQLAQIIRDNQIAQIRLCNFALASESGTRELYLDTSSDQCNHTPSMVRQEGKATLSVPVSTLDECVADWKIDQIDFLKVDIEGFELAALKGARETFRSRKVKRILCEFNDHWLRSAGTSCQELFDFLLSNGFSCTTRSPKFPAGSLLNLVFVL